MDYFARRHLYYNNRSPPILLNNGSYNKNRVSSQYSKNNISQIIPSYSGNPHIIKNYKTNIYSSNNFYSTYNNQPMTKKEIVNSRYKINNNLNNNKSSNNILYHSKYPKYNEPINNSNKSNDNNYNYYYSTNNREVDENLVQKSVNLRAKILNLSNNLHNKALTKNYSMNYLPLRKNYSLSQKKKLILDLDETLVHSGFNPFTRESDISLQINIDGKTHTINILKRPYVDEFLKEVSNYFDVYVFTASMEEYASPVINLIDKNNVVNGKFYRQDCIFNNGLYIKDLLKVSNDLRNVIIIDNNPSSYATNEDNGIPIKTWYDDLNDNELQKLIPLLKYLSNVNDVRNIIRQIVDRRKNEVDFYSINKIINGNNNNNKIYKNNFYHEINESKLNMKDNINSNNNNDKEYEYKNDNYYSRYDKYNKINSFSNMSYNEIQNEEEHLDNNYNYRMNNYDYNNNEENKYNQINENDNNNDNYYQKDNINNINDNNYQNDLFRSMDFEREKEENNNKYNLYMDDNDNNNQYIPNNNVNAKSQNFFYEEKRKKIRPFTPNINRRKTNSFFSDVINNENNDDNTFINDYKSNYLSNNNNEEQNGIDDYYYDKKENLYSNNNSRLNTQNVLNRSSSDFYVNIRRNDNLKRYDDLFNFDNKENNRKTEINENNNYNNDYYLQSYKKNLTRTNYRTKEYNKNGVNNSIIKPKNVNIKINNYINNLNNPNKANNYLDYFPDKNRNTNNHKYHHINSNSNIIEEKYERYNYKNKNMYNNKNYKNKNEYLENLNQFKEEMNSRFNNFRNFIMDKRKEIFNEENKSRNFELPENYLTRVESYGPKQYLGKNVNNYNNYLERTNLQNLINDYRNKYNAFEKSIHNKINNNKLRLNQTFSVDKNNMKYNNNVNRYFDKYNN